MAVTECRIQYDSQSATVSYLQQQTLPTTWLITCDSRQDGPVTARTQAYTVGPEPLPRPGSRYAVGTDYDENTFVESISMARKPGTDRHWLATCNFSNTIDPGQSNENPLLRPPIDEWDTEQFQRLVFTDIDGNMIANSARTALKIYADDSRPILTYTRNEPTYPYQILTYQDAINSDPFLGIFPPYTAKVNISARKQFESGVKFYSTQYRFHFRHDTWRQYVLNEGNQFRWVNEVGEPDGTFFNWPRGYIGLLDADGYPLPAGADPTFEEFKIYRELPFAPLGIVIA